MTATIRGAPSAPLNIRVAETNALRFAIWVCFALFRRFKRDWAAALVPEEDLGD